MYEILIQSISLRLVKSFIFISNCYIFTGWTLKDVQANKTEV